MIKKSAKKLRQSTDTNVLDKVYINPHLTKAERAAAYERCQRRVRGARQSVPRLNANVPSFHPPDNPAQ